MSASNNASNSSYSNNVPNQPQSADSAQPTVRVMRLYKPGFHFAATPPQIDSDGKARLNDFPLSPYLLLPDSFGDIYAGEKFSAYIAVVNGFQNISFYNMSLAVRLQTANNVIDLFDSSNGPNKQSSPSIKILDSTDTLDMIVSQVLNELGTHTLRVSVAYQVLNGTEPKTLRKFYRFNVLQPLTITSYFIAINNKPFIQCQVTNNTKSPVFLEELNFIPKDSENFKVIDIHRKINTYLSKTENHNNNNNNNINQEILSQEVSFNENNFRLIDSSMIHLLQPEESYAYSFILEPMDPVSFHPAVSVGYPEVKWSTTMGEYSIYKGEETKMKIPDGSGMIPANCNIGISVKNTMTANTIKLEVSNIPSVIMVGEEFEAILTIFNPTNQPLKITLKCTNKVNNNNNNNNNNNEEYNSLCVVGLTSTCLGIVENESFTEIPINIYPLRAGLFDLVGIYCIDTSTKKELSSPNNSLCKIFVKECEGQE